MINLPARSPDPSDSALRLSEDVAAWTLLIFRSAVGVTVLTMASHHVFTWDWFNALIHSRFDPVFGTLFGETLGRAFVSFHTRFQTTFEFCIAIPLLMGIRLREASIGACLLFITNVIGLTLEEMINAGDQHSHRLQVILWNHLQFLMALGLLVLSALPPRAPGVGGDVPPGHTGWKHAPLAVLFLRWFVGFQLLIPALWFVHQFVRKPFNYYSTQTYFFIDQLKPAFPISLLILGVAAIAILTGIQTRWMCAGAAMTLLFASSQFLMKKESLGGFSVYFLNMHVWNVVFLMFSELSLIALLQPLDRYSLERLWMQKRFQGVVVETTSEIPAHTEGVSTDR